MGNILGADVLLKRLNSIRKLGSDVKIVFTNGCFDVLHMGHLSLLEEARAYGILVVGLNSDESVQSLKPGRPINPLIVRLRMVAAFRVVDFVTYFEEETPLELIKKIKPDILVKGGDYTEESVVGAPEMKEWGGKVVIVPTVEGFSTTSIIRKIR